MKSLKQLSVLCAALLMSFSLMSVSLVAQTKTPASKPATKSDQTGWKQVPIPPLRAFHPQVPRRVALPNGMVLFLQEDHELPLIDGVIRIRGGRRDDPAAKIGLSGIYAETWRTGGTKTKTGDQLDDFLETRAAQVEAGAGADSTSLSWSSLKGDFDQVFAVVLDVLQHPEFRQDKIDLVKKQVNTGIKRRNDDINAIVSRESTKLAFGADSPYARSAEYATIAAITRDDLLERHKRTVAPNNMILGISGDFDSADMERKLREAFAALPQGTPIPKPEFAPHPAPPGIYLIEKNDVNQSEISMVTLGIERSNPDYYAIETMNELFGGGSSSRLNMRLRTKMGLAYSVGGGIGSSFDHPGIFRVAMGTKSGSTAVAIEALQKEILDLMQGQVTEAELKKAKDAMLNSFIFSVDSKDKVLGERMAYEFYGYPADFLESYRAGIEKVTVADVNRVAKKYIHPEKFAVLVVGNKKDFDRDLSTFGKVTTIDISIQK
jgi:zinc protease